MKLVNQHIAILGVGRSGRAAAVLALREGATVSAWDQAGEEAFAQLPAEVECHPNASEADGASLRADILVVSPGIDTYGSYVAAFSKHVSEVIGEVEFASRFYQGKMVGITGTNGKTTTTELVSRMLSAAGMGGSPCGNYGTPFAEVILQDQHPAAVALELSSFQLETIKTLKPDVAIWLNFAPDHMDRYKTVADYKAAKLRIFENQDADCVAVIRDGEDLPSVAAKVVSFSTEDPSAIWFSNGQQIWLNGEVFIDMQKDTRLRGLHNAENLMAAFAACQSIGVSDQIMRDALDSYAPPAHRCELIRTLDGVEYLNDSKATNLHALESALRSQTRPVVLIAGGKDKGLDYQSVVPLLKEKAMFAVTYGQIAGALAELFAQAVPSQSVETLSEATTVARDHATRGSCVLLSPGTSSFDQFNSYEHRGDTFRNLVHELH